MNKSEVIGLYFHIGWCVPYLNLSCYQQLIYCSCRLQLSSHSSSSSSLTWLLGFFLMSITLPILADSWQAFFLALFCFSVLSSGGWNADISLQVLVLYPSTRFTNTFYALWPWLFWLSGKYINSVCGRSDFREHSLYLDSRIMHLIYRWNCEDDYKL